MKNKSINREKPKRDLTYLAAVFASALVLSLSAVGLYRLNIKTAVASEYAAEGISEVLSKRGSTGTEVINIQKKLKNWGYYTGSVDGIYGKLKIGRAHV